jgi:Family of unknown function (DUF5947)
MTTGQFDVLQRLAATRPPVAAGERCEMCGEAIAQEHPHVVDLTSRALMCTCRPCMLLFDYQHAQLRYRAVPNRYLSFPSVRIAPAMWDDLQIPVGLVFLFRNSALERTVAFYPGPAGATESELPLGAWDAVLAAHPTLGIALPDVEALLLQAPDQRGDGTVYLVPIDSCYELVGALRQVWRGFDGGQQARARLAEYFATIASRSRPALAAAP